MITGDKIFVCSPCYDLLDLRAEIGQLLRDLSFQPVMSDESDSAFEVLPDRNSIETCLVNVKNSDAIFVILSQRYGPILSPYGYDVSATHLEYKTAIASKKPVFVFVRDKLHAEFGLWKKNKTKKIDFQWLQDEKPKRIKKMFQWIEEHERRVAASTATNWTAQFQNSIDLKRTMQRWLTSNAGAAILNTLIAAGNQPLLSASLDRWTGTGAEGPKVIKVLLKNVGTTPAINARVYINPRENSGTKVSTGTFAIRPSHLGGTFSPREVRGITLERVKQEKPGSIFDLQVCYNTLAGYETADEYTLVWSEGGVTIDYSGKRLIGVSSLTLGSEELQPLQAGETPV